jgi:DNA-binding ferritin-like protein (Dps family)
MFNYKSHNFTQEPENDPNQSWLAPEEDDFYDQNDEEVFGDMDKEEDYDYSDEEELEEVKTTNTKMKKSEFKDKIKEMILKEMEDEKVVDVNDETPESEEDFLAELEGMLNEASEFDTNKPARIAAFIKDLDALMDEYHAELYLFGGVLDAIEMVKKVAQEEIDMLNEAEGDEEVTDDVTTDDVAVDDTETIDTTTTTEVNPDVKAVQDSLTQAQAAAQKLGDPKLTDQIGNTITFFTRNHVVEKGAVAEVEEMEEETLNESMFPMLKRILK